MGLPDVRHLYIIIWYNNKEKTQQQTRIGVSGNTQKFKFYFLLPGGHSHPSRSLTMGNLPVHVNKDCSESVAITHERSTDEDLFYRHTMHAALPSAM